MKKLIFSFLATVLFSVCGNAQTDVVKENLEKQVRSTLENYLEISKNLLLVKNTRVDDKLIYKIQNQKLRLKIYYSNPK